MYMSYLSWLSCQANMVSCIISRSLAELNDNDRLPLLVDCVTEKQISQNI